MKINFLQWTFSIIKRQDIGKGFYFLDSRKKTVWSYSKRKEKKLWNLTKHRMGCYSGQYVESKIPLIKTMCDISSEMSKGRKVMALKYAKETVEKYLNEEYIAYRYRYVIK